VPGRKASFHVKRKVAGDEDAEVVRTTHKLDATRKGAHPHGLLAVQCLLRCLARFAVGLPALGSTALERRGRTASFHVEKRPPAKTADEFLR
jgi:hypothetical protein